MRNQLSSFFVLVFGFSGALAEPPATKELTETEFNKELSNLLANPTQRDADVIAKKIVMFMMGNKHAVVILGPEELKWGFNDEKYGKILFAAFVGGNTQSQLYSGVHGNDRYSGLISLFKAYRQLKANDSDFTVKEIETLLALHKEGKMMQYLIELEKKQPTDLLGKHPLGTIKK